MLASIIGLLFVEGIHGAVAAHGQLNILCNNAGVIDENNWEKMLEIDLVCE